MSRFFRLKPVANILEESQAEGHGQSLQRVLTLPGLLSLGIGIIMGAGVFVLTGNVAAVCAGPGVILSFALAALACMLTAMSYAEFAAFLPVSGSAYTYGYAVLGEIVAFFIGLCCLLEFMMGCAAITTGWSGYMYSFLQDHFGEISPRFFNIPGVEYVLYNGRWAVLESVRGQVAQAGVDIAQLPHVVTCGNYVGLFLILLMCIILIRGVEMTAKFNAAMVVLKLSLVVVFVGIVGTYLIGHIDVALDNWTPFIPDNSGNFGEFGWSGVCRGAAMLFFAYLGFDSVPTASQEAINPVRDIPRAIVLSLAVCAAAYISVCAMMTGIVPFSELNVSDPAAKAIDVTGVAWGKVFIKGGLAIGLAGGVISLLMSTSRVIYSIASDGLLPLTLSRVHARFRTPWAATIAAAVPIALLTAFFRLDELGELVSISALLTFAIVCVSVPILRYKYPERRSAFRTPWVPFLPLLGAFISLGLMLSLTPTTLLRFAAVIAIGLVFYFVYGAKHSRLAKAENSAESEP